MNRIKHGQKRWRMKWPWNRLFPLRIDERFCRECGLPYHHGPLPKELAQFTSGNVAVVIYPAGNFGNRHTFAMKVGRWKAFSGTFQFSPYIPEEEFEDLVKVAARIRKFLESRQNVLIRHARR